MCALGSLINSAAFIMQGFCVYLMSKMHSVTCIPGEMIVRAGDIGNKIYFVNSGNAFAETQRMSWGVFISDELIACRPSGCTRRATEDANQHVR